MDTNSVTCEKCGGVVDTAHSVWTNNTRQVWCNKCSELTLVCDHCNFIVPNDDGIKRVCGESWCPKCVSDSAFKCEHCDEYASIDQAVSVGDCRWCEQCASEDSEVCDHCRNRVNQEDTTEIDGDTWCDRCVRYDTVVCENCGERSSTENMSYIERTGCWYCGDCGRPSNGPLYEYHCFDKSLTFHGEGRKAGFELEVGDGDHDDVIPTCETLNNIDPMYKRFHTEEDGSIPGGGFELISMPHDMKSHVEYDWGRVLKIIGQGFFADTCEGVGLHVHVEKKGITPMGCAKIDIFVAHHFDFFSKVARRTCTAYAKPKKINEGRWGVGNDRYRAVNFRPSRTIEFRLWQSTLDHKMLLGYIELSLAIVEWTPKQPVMSLLRDHGMKAFREYLKTKCLFANALITNITGE